MVCVWTLEVSPRDQGSLFHILNVYQSGIRQKYTYDNPQFYEFPLRIQMTRCRRRDKLQLNYNKLRLQELAYAYRIVQLFNHHLNIQKVAQRTVEYSCVSVHILQSHLHVIVSYFVFWLRFKDYFYELKTWLAIYDPLEKTGLSWGKWNKNCLRPSELLGVNGRRHFGFTFLIGWMTEVPDIYRAQWLSFNCNVSQRRTPNWLKAVFHFKRNVPYRTVTYQNKF